MKRPGPVYCAAVAAFVAAAHELARLESYLPQAHAPRDEDELRGRLRAADARAFATRRPVDRAWPAHGRVP